MMSRQREACQAESRALGSRAGADRGRQAHELKMGGQGLEIVPRYEGIVGLAVVDAHQGDIVSLGGQPGGFDVQVDAVLRKPAEDARVLLVQGISRGGQPAPE
jgi:hypothetical protein